jgi:hypothetical protein
LCTLRGTLADVVGRADAAADAHLRVVRDEPARAGLADEVRSQLPNTVEVAVTPRGDAEVSPASDRNRLGRTPRDLVAEYLSEHDAHDERVVALFDELVDELTGDVGGAPR